MNTSVVNAVNILDAARRTVERDSVAYRILSDAMAHLYRSVFNPTWG